ncbi:hypothetical protein CPB83DRAFT_897394 [Crepidotus variabilis]|uniref:CBM1 domain-containing protein n=1 Tax=Crepidotus variabilis TaxID=179855 RepID=A0A9P6E9K4_9AGAR|nr:hypothetical protein CPB83DRAFT_897394 [Crepidotus variabilis]
MIALSALCLALGCFSGTVYGRPPNIQETLAPTPNYWFSFGASSSQTGFNSNGTLPNEANPIGNPTFPGNTFAGGINWVGYLTSYYNNSLLFTYNYAIGGATINRTLVNPGSSKALTEEIDEFMAGAGKKPSVTPWKSENSLFSFYIGINDLQATYNQGGDRGAFSDLLLDSYFAQAKRLYDVGARYFLFFNIPPTDRTPLMLKQSETARATERAVIIEHNKRLSARATDFQNSTSGVHIAFYDIWTHYEVMLNSPQTYGFKDATSYGDALDIYWANDFHAGVHANDYFAQVVVAAGGDDKWAPQGHGSDWCSDGQCYEKTQVLWGQCGGYYYEGTDKCPSDAYCRYFSDWYSQCNPIEKSGKTFW